MKLYDLVKTVFIIIIFIALWPTLWNKIKTQWFDAIEPKNKVGIIHMQGSIDSSTEYVQALKELFENNEIKAVLLDIDSAGGSAGASQAIVEEIIHLKKLHPKPIISYSENTCASGAYHIACATDYIVTTGSCVVGSIGSTLSPQFYLSELLKNHHIETLDIHSGEYKNSINYINKPSEQEQEMLQKICDDTYEQFYTFVSIHRNLPVQNKDSWAQGKLFTGKQALDIGLVDALGCKSDATAYIKNHIVPTQHPIEWIHAYARQPWEKYLTWTDFFNFDFIESSREQTTHKLVKTMIGILTRPIVVQ
jgi:signal peptide peptidase SppA